MNIRHLRFFVALAGERHYGRAAKTCNVTQSTLSEAIRQLERELAVPLFDRTGTRNRGLTPEGVRALGWAKRILADGDALEQELAAMRKGLSGDLRFGVIPAAMPVTPVVTSVFCRSHPRVTFKVLSRSSAEIQRGLDSGELDAGLTYLDNEPLESVRTLELYREHYMLLTPSSGNFYRQDAVTWTQAALLPLCLLTGDMQNRRIIDGLFVESGVGKPKTKVETDSVLALIAHVRSGEWSSIVPNTFLTLVGHGNAPLRGLRAIPLVEPRATQTIGLVVSDRDPLSPLTHALLKSAKQIDLPIKLGQLLSGADS
jgi:DNA-binding transcriptional LysR family regulator